MLFFTLSHSDKQLQNSQKSVIRTVQMFEIPTENSNIFDLSAADVNTRSFYLIMWSRAFRKLVIVVVVVVVVHVVVVRQ